MHGATVLAYGRVGGLGNAPTDSGRTRGQGGRRRQLRGGTRGGRGARLVAIQWRGEEGAIVGHRGVHQADHGEGSDVEGTSNH